MNRSFFVFLCVFAIGLTGCNPIIQSSKNETFTGSEIIQRSFVNESDDAAHFKYYEKDLHIIHWYEWWYATVKSDNRSVLALFFTFGNLNRPFARVVGALVAVFDGSETIESVIYAPFVDFTLDYERCNITIAGNKFYIENGTFFVTYEKDDVSVTMSITPDGTPFTSIRELERWQWGGWHTAVPYGTGNATFTVNGKTQTVTGRAYHDHNWGMSRKRQLNWDWSEWCIGNASIVYGAAGHKILRGGIHYTDNERHLSIMEDKAHIDYIEWGLVNGCKKPTKMHMYGENEGIRVDLYIELEKVYTLEFGPVKKSYLLGRAYGEIQINGTLRYVNTTGFYEHHGNFN